MPSVPFPFALSNANNDANNDPLDPGYYAVEVPNDGQYQGIQAGSNKNHGDNGDIQDGDATGDSMDVDDDPVGNNDDVDGSTLVDDPSTTDNGEQHLGQQTLPQWLSKAQDCPKGHRPIINNLAEVKRLFPLKSTSNPQVWSQADQQQVQQAWKDDPRWYELVEAVRTRYVEDRVQLYNVCMRLYGCLPEQIVTIRFGLVWKLGKLHPFKNLPKSLYIGPPGIVCDHLLTLLVHPMFHGNIRLLRTAILYTVNQASDDRRPWLRGPSPDCNDVFLHAFLNAAHSDRRHRGLDQIREELLCHFRIEADEDEDQQPPGIITTPRASSVAAVSRWNLLFATIDEMFLPRRQTIRLTPDDAEKLLRRNRTPNMAVEPLEVGLQHLVALKLALDRISSMGGVPDFQEAGVYRDMIMQRYYPGGVKGFGYPSTPKDLQDLRGYTVPRERELIAFWEKSRRG